ncbi:MAG: winged helix-turn-helix transcriptional regulator [Thermoplasmata archaeon]|nr:winged helix-turn-helix transcriptional regulator [Thermoplasmata archaeon]
MALTSLHRTRGSLELIVYLYRKGEATTTELIRCTPACQETVYKALDQLLSLGMVRKEEEGVFPRRINFSLTEKGKKLAESSILEWDRIVNP